MIDQLISELVAYGLQNGLVEGIAIYGLIISIMILNEI